MNAYFLNKSIYNLIDQSFLALQRLIGKRSRDMFLLFGVADWITFSNDGMRLWTEGACLVKFGLDKGLMLSLPKSVDVLI